MLQDTGLDIIDKLTIASAAISIYKNNFMRTTQIPIIQGKCEQALRESYRGGVVHVYKPKITEGEEAYMYDINSLYPASMLYDMPIGTPLYIAKPQLKDFYGFAKARITTPREMKIPFLPTRLKTGEMVVPLGDFGGWYYSEELKYAEQLGYTIDLEVGYQFTRGKSIFKDYVTKFYELKRKATNPVQKTIAKLLLNSLYGRFGMRADPTRAEILTKSEFNHISQNHQIKSYSEIMPDRFLVQYDIHPDYESSEDYF